MLIETRDGGIALTGEDATLLEHAKVWVVGMSVVRKQTRHAVLNVCKLDTVTMQATICVNHDHSGSEPKRLDTPRYTEHDLSDCVLVCYDEHNVAHVVDSNLQPIDSDFFQPSPVKA